VECGCGSFGRDIPEEQFLDAVDRMIGDVTLRKVMSTPVKNLGANGCTARNVEAESLSESRIRLPCASVAQSKGKLSILARELIARSTVVKTVNLRTAPGLTLAT
jgi:hypothetical protein